MILGRRGRRRRPRRWQIPSFRITPSPVLKSLDTSPSRSDVGITTLQRDTGERARRGARPAETPSHIDGPPGRPVSGACSVKASPCEPARRSYRRARAFNCRGSVPRRACWRPSVVPPRADRHAARSWRTPAPPGSEPASPPDLTKTAPRPGPGPGDRLPKASLAPGGRAYGSPLTPESRPAPRA